MNIKKLTRQEIETFEYLNDRFEYSPVTGLLFWKILWPGKIAGTIVKKPNSFIKIAICKKDFKAHRIAWVLHHKKSIPKDMVTDHIDGDPLNNSAKNLRLCTQKENSRNSVTPKNNTTGFKGVSACGKRYRAYISVNGKQIHLGLYDTPEEGFAAYMDSAKIHFGDFKSYG